MPVSKNKIQIFKKTHLPIIGVLLLILLAIFLLWFNNNRSMQATPAIVGSVYFDGEYRIEDGEWHQIVKDEHIPATKGDVTLSSRYDPVMDFPMYSKSFFELLLR